MPSSPHDSSSTARLRAYLEAALPDSQVSDAAITESYRPLLLLHTAHTVAAFAFSNGDMAKSYEALYGSFRNHYAAQKGAWDKLDLAFVFCVDRDIPNLDRFSSAVETNVYFCRKYVVHLVEPLGESLARLPFLPLTPLHGGSFRPPSAQTFLQQCAVPTVLAKHLVVPRASSPEGIVEDCLTGTFGEPKELSQPKETQVHQVTRTVGPITIESVTVKNFRAYRQAQTFTLGPDVTVLYGPNGFGKTSFFDAVDFAATGEIGRLESSSDASLKAVAKHLDSESEESSVSLSFSSGSTSRKIIRHVSDPKHALLDGRTVDRKALLGELTAGTIPTADRVDPFIRLFRATHLFSQEHQELARDFHDDCTLSNEVVSRMLAFEDYSNAVAKAKRVVQLLETIISSADRDIHQLSEQIADETGELDRLRRNMRTELPSGVLQTQIKSLRRQLKEMGIATPEDADASGVRGWRADIELRHSETEHILARLTTSAEEVDGLSARHTEIVTLQKQIEEQNIAFLAADRQRPELESGLQREKENLAHVTTRRTRLKERAQALAWIRSVRTAYANAVTNAQDMLERVNRSGSAWSEARILNEDAIEQYQRDEKRARGLNDALAAAREKRTAIEKTRSQVSEWQNAQQLLGVSKEASLAAGQVVDALRKEGEELIATVAALARNEKRLRDQIAEVDRNQSELRQLLSQLQGHVANGVCPLCGEDHGSRADLLQRIERQVLSDAASIARKQLSDTQEESRRVAEQLGINERRTENEAVLLSTTQTELRQLESTIAILAAELEGSGIYPASFETGDRLERWREESSSEESLLLESVRDATAAVETQRAALGETANALKVAEQDLSVARASLERLNQEVARFRGDKRVGDLSLDIDVDEHEATDLSDLATVEASVAAAEREVTAADRRQESNRSSIAALKSSLPPLRARLAALQKDEAAIVARLKELKLSPDVTKNALLELIATESQRRTRLASLRDAATSIELSFDAANTSAAFSILAEKTQIKQRAVSAASQRRDIHKPWAQYFQNVVRLVSSEQNEAIDQLTAQYGPRTSTIQRRLRTVYGFDQIEITSRQGTISVGVMRRGVHLRPTDYFSQSQQQTLLLGLFLTACLSQNWSALRPVFLDDPVTHFDDLNTYAFLDLIVGLLESGSDHRQFVLSTCDERFLQLARQKFHHLGDRARFYSFTAIGPEGPVVRDTTA